MEILSGRAVGEHASGARRSGRAEHTTFSIGVLTDMRQDQNSDCTPKYEKHTRSSFREAEAEPFRLLSLPATTAFFSRLP